MDFLGTPEVRVDCVQGVEAGEALGGAARNFGAGAAAAVSEGGHIVGHVLSYLVDHVAMAVNETRAVVWSELPSFD